MGKPKISSSDSDNSDSPSEQNMSSQDSPEEYQPNEPTCKKTRSRIYRKNLSRRSNKVLTKRKEIKPNVIPYKDSSKISLEFIGDPDCNIYPKSDIEEDECIPNGSKSIECFICGCRLNKIYSLRNHMRTHLQEESYDLKNFENSEIFNILNPHKRNIDSKTIQKFIMQEIQAKRYSQFYCILNEAAVELNISDSETDSDGTTNEAIPRNNYRCEMCKKNFDRRYKAMFHQKTTHTKNDLFFTCDYCPKKFVSMNLLIHHLKTQCENDEKPIPCTERFMKYLLKVNLDYYANLAEAREQRKLQKVNEGPKSYTCDICKKTFTRQEHLNRHRAVHLPDEMKFECVICDRRFNRKDNMRSHMKTHTEEGRRNAESKKILCSYCGRSFSSKSNYVVHMRRHTGEKPYKCEICGKGFPKSTDLNSHKITHTGAKDFVCTICDKSFARSAVLSKHMKVHNGPYPCKLCDKMFVKPSALTVHLRIHKAERSCVCLVCNKTFSIKKDLDLHFIETGHNNEPKRMIVIRETLMVEKNVENERLADETKKSVCDVEKRTSNDDPLEIDEEELRNTKVKVPVNEVIQNVLQNSTSTHENVKSKTQNNHNIMPPLLSPINVGSDFNDDPQFDCDW